MHSAFSPQGFPAHGLVGFGITELSVVVISGTIVGCVVVSIRAGTEVVNYLVDAFHLLPH